MKTHLSIVIVLAAVSLIAAPLYRYGKLNDGVLGQVTLAESPPAGEVRVPNYVNTGAKHDGTNWMRADGLSYSAEAQAYTLTPAEIVRRLTDAELLALEQPANVRIRWLLMTTSEISSDGPIAMRLRALFPGRFTTILAAE